MTSLPHSWWDSTALDTVLYWKAGAVIIYLGMTKCGPRQGSPKSIVIDGCVAVELLRLHVLVWLWSCCVYMSYGVEGDLPKCHLERRKQFTTLLL